jgi:4,4'-diaponeurosporenoate glycosyltransferase
MHAPHYIAILGWLLGWVLLWRLPRLERAKAPKEGDSQPDVTVIIPARNEKHRIGRLMDSLAEHRPPNMRVIVVDDHSEDGTAEFVSQYPFVDVLHLPDLPPGWLGKPWACHNGAQSAKPGVLVFMDADIWLHEGGIEHVLEAWRKRGGLISVYPFAEMERPYEHLSMFSHIVAMMGVRSGSLLQPRKPAGALGTLFVMSTDDYETTGGLSSVRNDVVEDFALAKVFGAHDLPVRTYGGHEDFSARCYPDGIRSLAQGWIKALGPCSRKIPFLLLAGIAAWMVCAIGGLKWVHGPFRWESGMIYGLFVIQVTVMARQVGSYNLLSGLLYPFLGIFFIFVYAISLFKTFFMHKVTWRGRTIDVR